MRPVVRAIVCLGCSRPAAQRAMAGAQAWCWHQQALCICPVTGVWGAQCRGRRVQGCGERWSAFNRSLRGEQRSGSSLVQRCRPLLLAQSKSESSSLSVRCCCPPCRSVRCCVSAPACRVAGSASSKMAPTAASREASTSAGWHQGVPTKEWLVGMVQSLNRCHGGPAVKQASGRAGRQAGLAPWALNRALPRPCSPLPACFAVQPSATAMSAGPHLLRSPPSLPARPAPPHSRWSSRS